LGAVLGVLAGQRPGDADQNRFLALCQSRSHGGSGEAGRKRSEQQFAAAQCHGGSNPGARGLVAAPIRAPRYALIVVAATMSPRCGYVNRASRRRAAMQDTMRSLGVVASRAPVGYGRVRKGLPGSMRYSGFSLLFEALRGHRDWKPAWRKAEPKEAYDVVIVGGGGHGLATAFYLATEHGITNVAVLEKGYIGSGNAGRNTTIIRSNYLLPGNEGFYELSMKLWEGLEQGFNYNAMVSQRGVLNLYHSDAQRDAFARRGNAMRLHGVDADLLDRDAVRAMVPFLDYDNARFPIHGGLLQRRGGTARHDAVVWGYARGADMRGVDIIENCEVTGFGINDGRLNSIHTSRGVIRAKKVGIAVAGNSSRVAAMAGLRLPIESHVLQAFVSEGIK